MALHNGKYLPRAANAARQPRSRAMRYDAERMFRTHEPNAGDRFIHDQRPQARSRGTAQFAPCFHVTPCLAAGVAA